MEDFDIPQHKLAESADRVVDRALDEARRREHALLTNEHVCLAFAQAPRLPATIEQTRHILYNLRPRLERNYSVRIEDELAATA